MHVKLVRSRASSEYASEASARERSPNTGPTVSLPYEEAHLVALVLAGETQLFHDLVKPHEQRLYRMAIAIVRNPTDAEDVVQESYLKAFLNLSKFRFDARFSTWLTSITLNEARSVVRAKKHIAFEVIDNCSEAEGSEYRDLICQQPLPAQVVEQEELLQLVAKAVKGLHPTYRAIYDLREKAELSTQKAAALLGIPVPLAKTRLHRARKMLQQRLSVMTGVESLRGGGSESALPA